MHKVAAEILKSGNFDFMEAEFQITILKVVVRNVLRYAELLGEAPAP